MKYGEKIRLFESAVFLECRMLHFVFLLVRKYKFREGPFSPSRRLAILGGATNLKRPV